MHKKRPPLTMKQVQSAIDQRVSIVEKEFRAGLEFIAKYQKSVTFFGSSKLDSKNPYCQKAEHLAKRISSELGYAVTTGGGGGIMGAANKGAYEAGGSSLGLLIELPNEQKANQYLTDYLDFKFFFNRKVSLSFSAEAYIFFPGGFGTMDEFFEIVTLIQTGKIPKTPIICVGEDFWNEIKELVKKIMSEKNKMIEKEDLDLFIITDDETKIVEIIRNAPLRRE